MSEPRVQAGLKLLNDKILDPEKDKDAFNHQVYADILARIFHPDSGNEPGISVALFGKWGQGKSCVVGMLSRCLPQEDVQIALVRLHKGSQLDMIFLFWFLNGQKIKSHIEAINVQAAQANLSLKDIGEFKIPLPSLDEQRAIAQVLATADAEVATLSQKLSILKDQKKFLLNNLVTGSIRLPEFRNTAKPAGANGDNS